VKLPQRAVLIVLLSAACVGCDRLGKVLARQALSESDKLSYLNDIFRLQYMENQGAFLSIWSNASENFRFWFFIISVGLFLAGVLIFLLTSKKISGAETAGLSLILGGGIGNLIDRVFNDGHVIDFMNVGIGSLRTGVFNVADIAISVGGVLLLACAFKNRETAS